MSQNIKNLRNLNNSVEKIISTGNQLIMCFDYAYYIEPIINFVCNINTT